MDIQYIIDRVKGIILNPTHEWREVEAESKSNKELLLFYALPLVVLGVIAGLIGWGSLHMAVYQLAMPLAGIVIAAYVVNALAENFDSTKNLNNAFKLVTYAATPSMVAAIIANLSPFLSWVSLFGLYSIYLFWIGIPKLMDTPENKRLMYVIVAGLIIVVIQVIISAVIGPDIIRWY